MTEIEMESFLVGDTNDFGPMAKRVQRKLNNGWKPLMCLVRRRNYSVWAFVRENQTQEKEDDNNGK